MKPGEEAKDVSFFDQSEGDLLTIRDRETLRGAENYDEDIAVREEENCCCSQNSEYVHDLPTEETSSFIETMARMQETEAAEFLEQEGLLQQYNLEEMKLSDEELRA